MSLKYNHFLLSAYLPLMAVTLLPYAPANAGFEWTPPKETSSSPAISTPKQGDVKAPETLIEVAKEVIEEETITNESSKVKSLTTTSDTVIVLTPEPKDGIIWNETETFDVIEGFGTDMPLALALRQIVPVKYAFSFGETVNPGAVISWKGGKPWNIVLGEALSPLNVTYNIDGNKLKLSKIMPKESNVIIVEDPITLPALELKDKIKRKSILEPEPHKAKQPITSKILKETNLLEEKKKETELIEEEVDPEPRTELVSISSIIPNEQLNDVAPSPPKEVIEWNITEIVMEKKAPISVQADAITSDIDDLTISKEVIAIEQNNNDNPPPITPHPIKEEALIKQDDLVANVMEEPTDIENIKEIEVEPIKAIEIDTIEVITPADENTKITSLKNKASNDIKIWEAKRGFDLEEVLIKWSDEEKVKFTWYLSDNYKISKDVFISGTFKNAIDILFAKGIENAPHYLLTESPSYELNVGKTEE